MDLIRRRCLSKRNNKHYGEQNNRDVAVRSIKQMWKRTFGGSERSSRFRNAARALFSSYVAPFSRRLVSPFSRSVSRPADILAGRFPTRGSASNFFAAAIPAKIYRSDGRTAKMQGPFLRVRGERPHVPVSAIRSKSSRGWREPSRRKGGFLDFS